MLTNNVHLTELNSPNQKIKARVEFYKGSALEKICNCGDMLSDFTVEKTGEGKFFGFGICQKLRTTLYDVERELNLTTEHTVEASFGVGDNFAYPFPNFYISEVERDEDSNTLTVTAYDSLYRANNHTVSELNLTAPYTLKTFVTACSALLQIPIIIDESISDSFDLVFEGGANFDGTENIRRALNAAAEATQTIYYIDNNWDMVFKRLDKSGDPVLTVKRDEYLELINGGVCVLSNITHTTELDDSVSSIVGEAVENGVTQYIRDNPFWDLRDDIGTLLDNAQAIVGGTSIHQFECNWIGNYLLEICDKISLVVEDNSEIVSYVLDDTITFDGTLSQVTRWVYDENSAETSDNPTSIGDALNKTFARVDKVNKRIDLVVSESDDKFSALEITTEGIKGTVSNIETATQAELETIKKSQTSINQTAEDITLRVESIETNGTTKVDTGTGFTFNEEGLRINKDNSGIENLLDNTGMYVKQDGSEVLSVNEEGVKAKDLHAVTYLWIGSHSRFEDYEGGRTGCFWIGK